MSAKTPARPNGPSPTAREIERESNEWKEAFGETLATWQQELADRQAAEALAAIQRQIDRPQAFAAVAAEHPHWQPSEVDKYLDRPDVDVSALAAGDKTNDKQDAADDKQADTPSPYVPAMELANRHGFSSYKVFRKFLEDYKVDSKPDDRHKRRRLVHAADCLRAIKERDSKAEVALEVAAEMHEQIESRKAAARRKRDGK